MKINVFDPTGKKLTPIELNEKDFGDKVNKSLLAQALRIYESNSHQKTSKVKDRSEVVGSRRKIWKQKGTGRARHGDRYAPIFVGGGVAHGPRGLKPANLKLPKKMKRKALASAILLKIQDNSISALAKSDSIESKTQKTANLLAKIATHPKNKVLIVTESRKDNLYQASQNLQRVTMINASLVNAKDIISHDFIIITKEAINMLKNRVIGNNQINKELKKPSKSKKKENSK